jgi:hypothetical protein
MKDGSSAEGNEEIAENPAPLSLHAPQILLSLEAT